MSETIVEPNVDREKTAKPLRGKAALVTGGSRGIGAAIVRRLVKDGANVAFSYVASAAGAHKLAEELTKDGQRVLAFHADQADAKQVSRLVISAVE